MLRIRLRSGAAALALCAALGTSVVVSTSPAHATVVVPLTREQLVDWSDTVVRATVLSQQSLWNAQHTQIVTHSVLAVREYLKGSGPATLTLVTMGGIVGNLESRVDGEARFRAGQDIVVFAQSAGDGFVTLTALAQSLYVLVHSPGVEPMARRDVRELSFVRLEGASRAPFQLGAEAPEPFSVLASTVRARLRVGGGR